MESFILSIVVQTTTHGFTILVTKIEGYDLE